MTKLSVNVNKVATLRNTRPKLGIPNVEQMARLCLESGAHGITVHPRPDQRHIKPQDVHDIARLLKGYRSAEFNIEGNPFHEYMQFARDVRPTQCTLVPDDVAQSTSDHGWDLRRDGDRLRPVIEELRSLGSRVSLFMDATPEDMALAKELGADRIELYTEPYAAAFARGHADGHRAARLYGDAGRAAYDSGLGVNAGHDLNLDNLPLLIEHCPQIAEVSIGHALVADALELGMACAVQAYLAAIERYPTDA